MGARAPAFSALLLAWASGCGAGEPEAPRFEAPPLHLVATPESVAIAPGQSKDVALRLLDDHDRPVPDRVLQFSIVDDPALPGDQAAGATLSFDRGVTNEHGLVMLQIIAGPQPTMFLVRASTPRAPALELTVFVTNATLAPVELAPVLVDEPVGGEELTTVRLYVLDGTGCAAVRYDQLPAAGPFVRTIPSEASALFSTVNTEQHHQLVALGLVASATPRARGCVDLPGSLLLVDVPLRVTIPMHLFRAAAAGSYEVASHFPLGARLKSAMLAAESWTALARCPLDPARLWLDCTIDALQGDGPADPSDCHPADDEGPLGRKLSARRGVRTSAPGLSACHDKLDGAGGVSHDALVTRLFPTPRPPLLDSLGRLGPEALALLEILEVRSVLTLGPTPTGDQYQASHRLVSASFPGATIAPPIDLVSLGAPGLEARFVAGKVEGTELSVGTHGFTLRLGSAARLAFGRASLVPRVGSVDPQVFVLTLFGLAAREDGGATVTGCAALDALLCPDVSEPRGCLVAACTQGLVAMRRSLEAGFAALDGDDLDLVLGGTAAVIDADGDGQVDALGALSGDPGLWSGELRSHAGPALLTGTWTAARTSR